MLAQIQPLLNGGRYAEARTVLLGAMRRGSTPMLDNAMAIAVLRMASGPTELEQAEFYARRACDSLTSPPAEITTTLANILALRGKYDAAAVAFERALKAQPQHLNARLGLANVLRQTGKLTAAAELLAATVPTADKQAQAAIDATLAATLLWCGKVEEAWALARAASDRFPDDAMVASTLANTACYVPGLSRDEEHQAQRRYGELFDRTVKITPPPFPPRPTGTPLRIGFVSPDFRQHSVAYFLEPLLRGLRELEGKPEGTRIELYGYAAGATKDAMTETLKALFHKFQPIGHLSDHDAAVLVRKDAIDVLVDLAGHTLGHRLPLFLFRAARAQVSYLGYPSITGVSTMDGRIVDETTDPVGCENTVSPEKLIRVPAPFLAYTPPRDAPPIEQPPAAPFTFGSFNATPKINSEVIAAWSRILRETSGSRLLLKSTQFADAAVRANYHGRFQAAGIDPARVEILPPTAGVREHLAMYNRIHLALDTFPYCGTTTTCEAASMGVPTVTIASDDHGNRHVSRVGATLNTAMRLPDFIATSTDQYVDIAVRTATTSKLPTRSDVRAAITDGPLGAQTTLAPAWLSRAASFLDAGSDGH